MDEQRKLESLTADECDVLIAGAGPAGSVCAKLLADAGRSVLLFDNEEFPREKICGDGLIADSITMLRRLGLEDEVRAKGHRVDMGAVFSPSRYEVEVPGDYVTLRRQELDALLATKAVCSGVEFYHGKVSSIQERPGGAVICGIKGLSNPIKAKVAVVATGVIVNLMRGHCEIETPRPNALATRCYLKSKEVVNRLIISYDRSIVPGYSWIFPMGEGWYNVGCGVHFSYRSSRKTDLGAMFETFCKEFPEMSRLVFGEVERTEMKTAPLRCGLQGSGAASESGRVIGIGEVIGTTFPFTGEGIGKAMESAQLAAGAINQTLESGDYGVLARFGETVRSNLDDKYLGYRIAEKWVSNPWVNDFMLRRISASKFLHEAMVGVVNETQDPRKIFSISGLWNSIWK